MTANKGIAAFCRRHEKALWLGLMLGGAVLRLAFLSRWPAGFNQDEASIGYDAWALLQYGIDRNGNAWPALLVAWGSGQNALYAYLLMPFIALFGLRVTTVRLLAACIGVLTLAVFYALARYTHGVPTALAALAVLATNPWHIMASRWALESNILPFFLLLGLYCLVRAVEKPWFFPLAAASFALGLYAYGSAFIILPVFFLCCLVYFWKRHALRLWPLLAAALVFLAIGLPIILTNLVNLFGWEPMQLFGITLPQLTEARQAQTMNLQLWQNGKALLRALVYGDDGYIHNSLPYGTLLAPFGLVFAGVGIWRALAAWRRSRGAEKGDMLALAMLCSGLLCALVIEVNVNRVNFLWLPVIYFSAVGLAWLCALVPHLYYDKQRCLPARVPVLAAAVYLAVSLLLFGAQYTGSAYVGSLEEAQFAGLGSALLYAEQQREETGAERIFVTTRVNMPYIYALFFSQTPPDEFVETVEYADPDSDFRWVYKFGHYEFDLEAGEGQPGVVYIITPDMYTTNMRHLARFGGFIVAVAENT